MNKNYLLKASLFCLLFSMTSVVFSQSDEQRQKITKDYDKAELNRLQAELSQNFNIEKKRAIAMAKKNGWPIFIEKENGSYEELMKISPDGKPIYYALDNVDAAISTRADHLKTGGSLGLDLEGENMIVRVWDGGPTRPTHQEYQNPDNLGETRVTISDGNTTLDGNSFHACHVTGTIIARGAQAAAEGMAIRATARTFDWNNDEAEAAAEAADGMLLSNHSYGVPVANAPGPWFIGSYTSSSYNWDLIAYNAPYYLPVLSAGNDGNSTNANPTGAGYDKLIGNKVSKNVLVVANAQDANVNGNGDLISVAINSGSSEGPADDGRIKPDITGNGTGLYSSYDSSDTAYNSISGTSMAAPNVTGTLLLLQQHYNDINGGFMKSATLKALATHTADDAGNPGPDAVFGWGLLNGKAAAEAISDNGFGSWISEESLSQGETFTMQVESDGSGPLMATIVWTDLPGTQTNDTAQEVNPTWAALVNDLDIRITDTSNNTYYPWKLSLSDVSANATRNSDNVVDNVERIEIDAPAAGTYTITVTHKGTLAGGPQNFSLVATGLTSSFRITSTELTKTACSGNGDANFAFDYTQVGGGTTNFSVTNLPTNATANFDVNSLSASGSFNLSIGNLTNVANGEYVIDVIADNGTETEIRKLNLKVLHSSFGPLALTAPVNGDTNGNTSMTLTWNTDVNAESYDVEVSTTPTFSSLVASGNERDTNFNVSGLMTETIYYWRVKPKNTCAEGTFSEIFSFQLGTQDCSNTYTSTTSVAINNTEDNSGAAAYGNGWSRSVINVPDNLNITDITVQVDVTHTWVEDLTLYLESPATFNTLVPQGSCGQNDDINATFTDAGTALNCVTGPPTITGNVAPNTPFSVYGGTASAGEWSFTTRDQFNGDNGTINGWTLTICGITAITNVPSLVNNGLTVPGNSSYAISASDLMASTTSETAAQQEYKIIQLPALGTIRLNTTTLGVGDTFTQDDIDNGFVTFDNTETSNTSDSFKVEVKNAANGWLGNQSVSVTIQSAVAVSPIVFLEGSAINPVGGEEQLMREDLRVAGVIPTTTPYTDSATCNTSVFSVTGSDAIVDWIWLELRSAADHSVMIAGRSALLKRDGTIVDTDGVSPVSINAATGNYYIAINHRNHLGIISSSTYALSSVATIVDFTTSSAMTIGGTNAVNLLANSKYAMISGDNDGNGQVQNTDVSGLRPKLGTAGYDAADQDMNGQIQLTDVNNALRPNIGKGEQN
ncbi:S8 family serine peptidase [Sungkyunkwania multivorans]|uniref:S8 family serine peptidase n=1 Tax=Sungkyunkwania multivorans TaxID=1173618 RepID=A0ABW3D167_9FLAO